MNDVFAEMLASEFFTRKRSRHELRRIEAERFNLSDGGAKKILRKPVKKVAKVSTDDINFEEWQLEVAEKVFGKGNND